MSGIQQLIGSVPHAVLSTSCHALAALQVEDCKLSSHAMRALTHLESARRLPAGQASLFDEALLQPQFIQSFRSTLQAGLTCAVMISLVNASVEACWFSCAMAMSDGIHISSVAVASVSLLRKAHMHQP